MENPTNENFGSEFEKGSSSKCKVNTTEELISLITSYQTEWLKRDEMLWQHAIQLFIATIFVMFCPHLIGVVKADELHLYNWAFYLFGIAMAFFSLIVLLASQRRIKITGDHIRNMYAMFPDDYCRGGIDFDIEKAHKRVTRCFVRFANTILKRNLNTFLLIAMFAPLMFVGILMMLSK